MECLTHLPLKFQFSYAVTEQVSQRDYVEGKVAVISYIVF